MLAPTADGGNLSLELTFPETNELIRVVGTQLEPAWVAKDVCDLLGIAKPNNVLREFDSDEKGACTIRTPGGPQEMLIVTEPGLYRLILKSRKPDAAKFKRWICHEVLPSIRLHGCYPPPALPANPNVIVLRQLADSIVRQDALESQQHELTAKLENLATKIRDFDSDTGYITVLAFARLKRIDLPRQDAIQHGKALTKIHRKRGVRIGQVPDERHGKVNAYRIDLVEEYFASLA